MVSMFQTPFSQPTFRELPYAMKKHWATELHDDLQLQYGNALLSWALLGEPICRVGESRTAIEMEDHRKKNILFEGVHRTGTIMVWNCGSWEPLTEGVDVLTCLERGFLRFVLRGGKLRGVWTLTRKSHVVGARRAEWTLFKKADLFDQPSTFEYASEVQPISIWSQKNKNQIETDWYKSRVAQATLFD